MTDELREAAWRGQLLEVIARYAHCMDSSDFDEIETLFADNAVFDIEPDPGIVPVPATGSRTIREGLEARYAVVSKEAQRRHMMTTTVFDELTESRAASRTFLTVISASKVGGGLTLHGSGVYHDRFVRSAGKWVFSERKLYVDELGHSAPLQRSGAPWRLQSGTVRRPRSPP